MRRSITAVGVGLALCVAAGGCSSTSSDSDSIDRTAPSSEGVLSSEIESQTEGTPTTDSGLGDPQATDQIGDRGYKFVLWSRSNRELLVNGFNVYDGKIESYRRRMSGYLDIEDDYFYLLDEGVGDVARYACAENLLLDGEEYSRDTSVPGNEIEFRPAEIQFFPRGIIDPAFAETFIPTDAVRYFERAGLTAPEPDEQGTRSIALDFDQIRALFAVGGVPGTLESPMEGAVDGSGSFETVEDGDGRLLRIRVKFVELGPIEEDPDGRRIQRSWETSGILSIEPLAATATRVDLSSPRPEEGYCADISAEFSGEWTTRQADDAWFTIGEAGQLSGYAACQSFTGTSEFAHNWLVDVELEIEGEQCPDGSVAGLTLIEMLRAEPGMWRYGDILVLFYSDGDALIFTSR